MKFPIFAVLLAVIATASPVAWGQPYFGLNDEDGMKTLESMEETELPDSLDKAAVPGVLLYPSPDKRFAFNRPTVAQAEKTDFQVSNHLVDLKTGMSLVQVTDGDGDFENRNHGGMRVLWRPDSKAAVFIAEHKWAPAAFRIVVIGTDGKASQILLDDLLLKEMRSQLLKKWPEIHKALKLDESQKFDGEYGPWDVEEIHYGCAFSKDGKTAKVKSTMDTNAKQIEGRVSAEIIAEGTISLETGKLTVAKSQVLSAGMMVYDEKAQDNVLKPLIRFSK